MPVELRRNQQSNALQNRRVAHWPPRPKNEHVVSRFHCPQKEKAAGPGDFVVTSLRDQPSIGMALARGPRRILAVAAGATQAGQPARSPGAIRRLVELGLKAKGGRWFPDVKFAMGEGKMTYRKKQSWPADRIQRRLRADEALMEIVRAERVFRASRKQSDIPAKPKGPIRGMVEIGLKKGK
jgi:hypothetical protein